MQLLSPIQSIAQRIRENVQRVIVGKDDVLELLLVAMATGGHVLLEDVPGTGKTMLAKSLSRSLDCTFRRIQFTPDLLPSDVTGVSIYHQPTGQFEFREGPIFAHIVLADEINRATPRTQSALLECMEEHQVTIDGVTRPLPAPFLVLATQNPIEQEGTFPLPEAQLDRFLLKLPLGYPEVDQEMEILDRFRLAHPFDALRPVATPEEIQTVRAAVPHVHVAREVQRYIVDVVRATRKHHGVQSGVSPRGTIALFRATQALAALRGRPYALPDDVLHLAGAVLGHRLVLSSNTRVRGQGAHDILAQVLQEIPVPAEPLPDSHKET